MLVYNYDRITKEYTGCERAFLDKAATLREGKEVYLIPAFATTKKPANPKKDNTIMVWNGGNWIETEDNRGKVIYNVETRQPKICTELGKIPTGYALELKPTVAETKARFLATLKSNFKQYLNDTKVEIPKIGLAFSYTSLDNIKKEKETGILVSRDDNNKIYSDLTSEDYDVIINYLTVFGQVLYLNKWETENAINKCNNLELLDTIKDKLEIKVDMKHLTNLVKMPEAKRKDYFMRLANNIK